MSELGDAVYEALSGEWQSVAEIADSIPKSERKDLTTHREMVRKHLVTLEKYRLAERSEGSPIKWRRVP